MLDQKDFEDPKGIKVRVGEMHIFFQAEEIKTKCSPGRLPKFKSTSLGARPRHLNSIL